MPFDTRPEQATQTRKQPSGAWPVGLPQLTPEQIDAFGREMDALREGVIATRGESDAAYIRKVIGFQRGLEVTSRGVIYGGVLFPPALVIGAIGLGMAKILENMEIGHNVMHGQWDWMRDPTIHSSTWEWDTVCPADQWKSTHNVEHHTWTNVLGKDRDVGYGILRMSEAEKWHPSHLLNPINNALLAVFFQWGVGVHDSELDQLARTGKIRPDSKAKLKGFWKKARKQVMKDYVLFPALAGPFFLPVLLANIVANLIRNLWTYMIIFCGHFPEGVHQFTEDEIENETRGGWYLRQLMGSANIEGGPLMHLMSGNLSFQIEHHLFPDLPSNRYAELSPKVRDICERYGLAYNSAPLKRQFGTTMKRVFRLALPNQLPNWVPALG